MLYYTGVGARATPPDILDLMTKIGQRMAQLGVGLRSGAAEGADAAFEKGCDFTFGKKQIFLPWKLFNVHESSHYPPSDEATIIASTIHPAWDKLSSGARKLHARNAHQVLGPLLDEPSLCVICWTKDGKLKGGTATAISLAWKHDIPVFNLGKESALKELGDFLREEGISPEKE